MKYYCLKCNKILGVFDRQKTKHGDYTFCIFCGSKVLSLDDTISYLYNKIGILEDKVSRLEVENMFK